MRSKHHKLTPRQNTLVCNHNVECCTSHKCQSIPSHVTEIYDINSSTQYVFFKPKDNVL